MKYSLRSLMIAAVLLPPLLTLAWFGWKSFQREKVFAEEIVVFWHLPYRDEFDTDEEYRRELQEYVPCEGGWKRLPAPPNPSKP